MLSVLMRYFEGHSADLNQRHYPTLSLKQIVPKTLGTYPLSLAGHPPLLGLPRLNNSVPYRP